MQKPFNETNEGVIYPAAARWSLVGNGMVMRGIFGVNAT